MQTQIRENEVQETMYRCMICPLGCTLIDRYRGKKSLRVFHQHSCHRFPSLMTNYECVRTWEKELIDIVNKDYKITARIMIQDGQHSHIRRFKSEMEYDGQIDDKFEMRVLRAFEADIQAEASQTTLPSKEKEEVPAKKSGKKPEGT